MLLHFKYNISIEMHAFIFPYRYKLDIRKFLRSYWAFDLTQRTTYIVEQMVDLIFNRNLRVLKYLEK
jgi:hypothetical protein